MVEKWWLAGGTVEKRVEVGRMIGNGGGQDRGDEGDGGNGVVAEWPAAVSRSRRVERRWRAAGEAARLDAPEILHAGRAGGPVRPGRAALRGGREVENVGGGGRRWFLGFSVTVPGPSLSRVVSA